MNTAAPEKGCLSVGSVVAFVMLLAGIAIPLAGGTDFGGAPRLFGTILILIVWLVAAATAVRARQWVWLAAITVLGPPAFVLYGTQVSEDFMFPEAWDQFTSPPWYLIALLLTPAILLLYGRANASSRR